MKKTLNNVPNHLDQVFLPDFDISNIHHSLYDISFILTAVLNNGKNFNHLSSFISEKDLSTLFSVLFLHGKIYELLKNIDISPKIENYLMNLIKKASKNNYYASFDMDFHSYKFRNKNNAIRTFINEMDWQNNPSIRLILLALIKNINTSYVILQEVEKYFIINKNDNIEAIIRLDKMDPSDYKKNELKNLVEMDIKEFNKISAHPNYSLAKLLLENIEEKT